MVRPVKGKAQQEEWKRSSWEVLRKRAEWYCRPTVPLDAELWELGWRGERGKRDVDCDKQVEKAVTAPNCVLKGSWGEGGSGGIRKKLKSEYAAYLESKYRRNNGSSI